MLKVLNRILDHKLVFPILGIVFLICTAYVAIDLPRFYAAEDAKNVKQFDAIIQTLEEGQQTTMVVNVDNDKDKAALVFKASKKGGYQLTNMTTTKYGDPVLLFFEK